MVIQRLLLLLSSSLFFSVLCFTAADGEMRDRRLCLRSLPTDIQVNVLKEVGLDKKIPILQDISRSLLCICIKAREQASLLVEALNSKSGILQIQNYGGVASSTHNSGKDDIYILLDILELFTHKNAWEPDCLDYKELLSIRQLDSFTRQTMEEIYVLLTKLLGLQIRCNESGVDLCRYVMIDKLEVLRSKITGLGLMKVLFPVSYVNLSCIKLEKADWIFVLGSLPRNVRKIDLTETNIDATGLEQLSRLDSLEEIDLQDIKLSNPADWASALGSLPTSVKNLSVKSTNIDAAGLEQLSRLDSLEELELDGIKLPKPADWASALGSLPTSVKNLSVKSTNIDATGLEKLSRLDSLEELELHWIKLSNPAEWASALGSLPTSVKNLSVKGPNIDAAGLEILSRLESLEEIVLQDIKLSNPGAWARILESWPRNVRKIDLSKIYIAGKGLEVLSRFVCLERIDFRSIKLSKAANWVRVLESLPKSVRQIAITFTNIDAVGLQGLSRLESLEEINLHGISLQYDTDWASALGSLPISVRKINLMNTNIDAVGLEVLSRLESLEEIELSWIQLSNEADWESVLRSLPKSVREIDLSLTNCPDELKEELKNKGIPVFW